MRIQVAAALLCAAASLPCAAADGLTVGSPAPPIDARYWFHGSDPVTEFRKGTVYVVEFWATWCGPCMNSIPLLADLQRKYPDELVVVGISDEEPWTVNKFLGRRSGHTNFREITSAFRLACDPDRSTTKDYMEASGERGLPAVFIVGRTGEIEWIGHPLYMDTPVERVLAGEWDREKEFRRERECGERLLRIRTLAREKNFPEAIAQATAAEEDARGDRLHERILQTRRSILLQAARHRIEEAKRAKEAEGDAE
jgi:thiol-disulfide isomerase/thioredoxin